MVALTKTERRIYRALQERPRSAAELRELALPIGRPSVSLHSVYVHINNLNRRLPNERVRMGDADSLYRLTETPRNLPAWKEFDPNGVFPA